MVEGNDKLKAKLLESRLVAAGKAYASSLRMLDAKLDLNRTHVLEGTLAGAPLAATGGGKCGIFFDHGNGQGQCLLLALCSPVGTLDADGSNLKIQHTIGRDMDFGPTLTFRLVIELDMLELYVNDYMLNLNRVKCNGQIGFIGGSRPTAGEHQSLGEQGLVMDHARIVSRQGAKLAKP